jgi:hypothetical protein
VLSYIDDFLIYTSLGRRSTEEDCVKASKTLDGLLARYGLIRHSRKGVGGRGSQVVMYLGLVVDTKRGKFGVPSQKLYNTSERARKLLARVRVNRRQVPAKKLETFVGKVQVLRLAVPDTAFRPRALYATLSDQKESLVPNVAREGPMALPDSACRHGSRFSSHLSPCSRYSKAVLSHPALRDLQFWRDLPRSLHHRPIWPEVVAPAAAVHIDASLTANGETLAYGEHDAGSKGQYEVQGYWDGRHREKTHITILELATVRLSLRRFLQHCVLRREHIVRVYTDNMTVMHTGNKWVSRSPTVMAELRRLYQLCSARPPFFVGNIKRHKLAFLLPTWRIGLDRLYSKSLSTGSHQGLQRPHLHGVPHGTPSAGRPCWHGRYGLFSAKASRSGWRDTCHEIGNKPTSLELFSPPLAVARVRELSVLQAVPRNQFFLARHPTK